MSAPLSEMLELCHVSLRACCHDGDILLDATAGHGYDTLFLASLAGKEGRVLALDKQPEALDQTAARLKEQGLRDRVELIQGDHADMAALLAAHLPEEQKLAAAVFNLGFLPGTDKAVRTSSSSTLKALEAVWPRLRGGALLSVHCYSGHEGAAEEGEAVAAWLEALDWKEARVTACTQHNKPRHPETLFLVHKR